jgi:protein tyrosine phosphatase
VIERIFEVTSAGQAKPHVVRQLHYLGWPDHGVPDEQSGDFEKLLFPFISYLLNSPVSERALVHCSAGIGRTGTTIALSELLISLASQRNRGLNPPTLSVFSTVRRLREQRFLMVQMFEQYVFLHSYLSHWINQTDF